MAKKSKIGVETPKKIICGAKNLATYLFLDSKCPAKISAKSVTLTSPN